MRNDAERTRMRSSRVAEVENAGPLRGREGRDGAGERLWPSGTKTRPEGRNSSRDPGPTMTGSPQNRWRSKLAPGQNGRGARVERVCVSAYKDASCGREGRRGSAEKPRGRGNCGEKTDGRETARRGPRGGRRTRRTFRCSPPSKPSGVARATPEASDRLLGQHPSGARPTRASPRSSD